MAKEMSLSACSGVVAMIPIRLLRVLGLALLAPSSRSASRSTCVTLVAAACFIACWLGVAATVLAQPIIDGPPLDINTAPRDDAGYSIRSPSGNAVLVVTPSAPDYTGPGVHSLFVHSDLRWRLETSFTIRHGVVADSGAVLGVSHVDGLWGSDCRLIGIDGGGRVFLQEVRRRHEQYFLACSPDPCVWQPNVHHIVLSKAGGVGIFISEESRPGNEDNFLEWWTYAVPGGEHRVDRYVPLPASSEYGNSVLLGTAALDDSPHVVFAYYVWHGRNVGARNDAPAVEFRVYDVQGYLIWNTELEEPAFNGLAFGDVMAQFENDPHCGSRPGGFYVKTSVSEQSYGLYRDESGWPWWKVRRTGVDVDKDK